MLVDGRKIGEQASQRHSPEQQVRFFDVEYKIPADLAANKNKITVKFEAVNGRTPSVFGIRVVRSDMER